MHVSVPFRGATQHVKDGRPSDGGAVEQGRAEEGSGDPMAPVRGRRGAARARGGGGTAGPPRVLPPGRLLRGWGDTGAPQGRAKLSYGDALTLLNVYVFLRIQ